MFNMDILIIIIEALAGFLLSAIAVIIGMYQVIKKLKAESKTKEETKK